MKLNETANYPESDWWSLVTPAGGEAEACLAHGRRYARDQHRLACWDLRK